MKSQNSTKFWVIAAGVALGVSLGIYGLVFLAIQNKEVEAREILLQAAELESKQGDVSQNLMLLKKRSTEINRIKEYFIKEREVVVFAERLESLGKDAGIPVTLQSLEPTTGQGGVRVLTMRIKASGTFGEVMRLEKLLENFPAKLEPSSVRIYRGDGENPLGVKSGNKSALPVWVLEVSMNALNFVAE